VVLPCVSFGWFVCSVIVFRLLRGLVVLFLPIVGRIVLRFLVFYLLLFSPIRCRIHIFRLCMSFVFKPPLNGYV